MADKTWQRHANPWSCWTRVVIAPLLALSIWSRLWIGWLCLVPVALLIVWTWINPRIFPKPSRTHNWATKAVFGERVWLNRKDVPIPDRHIRMANIQNTLAALGLVPFIDGLVILDFWMMICGLCIAVGAKMWFLDRMVWLYEDMKDKHSTYKSWLRS